MKKIHLIKNFFKKLEVISFLSLLFTSIFFVLFINSLSLIYKIFGIAISLIIAELIIRLILFIIYGSKYVYKVLPFYLIEDKKCGYKFRSNIDSEKINFPIFERYAFPSKIEPSKSAKLNKIIGLYAATHLIISI